MLFTRQMLIFNAKVTSCRPFASIPSPSRPSSPSSSDLHQEARLRRDNDQDYWLTQTSISFNLVLRVDFNLILCVWSLLFSFLLIMTCFVFLGSCLASESQSWPVCIGEFTSIYLKSYLHYDVAIIQFMEKYTTATASSQIQTSQTRLWSQRRWYCYPNANQ